MGNNLSKLQGAIALKEFLITAEITPPKGGNPERMLTVAKVLKNRVHGVNITDGSRAVLRMSSVAASALLLKEGIEPICQVTGRDRNSIGLQADLMGAYALGIRNILALTGDPIKAGDHTQARAVFELESIKLLKLIDKLNLGFDINNKPLVDGNLDLFAGAAVDPQSKSWSGLQRRFEKKIRSRGSVFPKSINH